MDARFPGLLLPTTAVWRSSTNKRDVLNVHWTLPQQDNVETASNHQIRREISRSDSECSDGQNEIPIAGMLLLVAILRLEQWWSQVAFLKLSSFPALGGAYVNNTTPFKTPYSRICGVYLNERSVEPTTLQCCRSPSIKLYASGDNKSVSHPSILVMVTTNLLTFIHLLGEFPLISELGNQPYLCYSQKPEGIHQMMYVGASGEKW
jgi:hypothetical protein